MLPKKIGQYHMDFSRDPQGQRGDAPFNARARDGSRMSDPALEKALTG
jgi:hypothetical protein